MLFSHFYNFITLLSFFVHFKCSVHNPQLGIGVGGVDEKYQRDNEHMKKKFDKFPLVKALETYDEIMNYGSLDNASNDTFSFIEIYGLKRKLDVNPNRKCIQKNELTDADSRYLNTITDIYQNKSDSPVVSSPSSSSDAYSDSDDNYCLNQKIDHLIKNNSNHCPIMTRSQQRKMNLLKP